MRHTIHHTRPKHPAWGSRHSFAYAGGEIRTAPLPPALLQTPQHSRPVPHEQPGSAPPLNAKETRVIADIPSPNPPQPNAAPPERPPRRRKPRDPVPIKVALPTDVAINSRQRGDISLNHHEAHCSICSHPDREAIDQAFLHWCSPTAIAYEFKLGSRRIVYRHAHAFRLFERRAAQSRHALGFIIEQAETVEPTADSIIRAIRAMSCIGDDGRWTEPPKQVIISHQYLDTRVEKVST